MTCRELVEFLNAYLSGELAPAERDEFERHLRVCSACVNYLDTYKKTIAMSKAAFHDDELAANVNIPESLVKSILTARKRGGA